MLVHMGISAMEEFQPGKIKQEASLRLCHWMADMFLLGAEGQDLGPARNLVGFDAFSVS